MFHYIGLGVTVAAAIVLLAVVVVFAIALWQEHGPSLHYRRPGTRMILSTYERDRVDGEGRDIRVSADLEMRRMIGVSWKRSFFFGLMLLKETKK